MMRAREEQNKTRKHRWWYSGGGGVLLMIMMMVRPHTYTHERLCFWFYTGGFWSTCDEVDFHDDRSMGMGKLRKGRKQWWWWVMEAVEGQLCVFQV